MYQYHIATKKSAHESDWYRDANGDPIFSNNVDMAILYAKALSRQFDYTYKVVRRHKTDIDRLIGYAKVGEWTTTL